MSSPLNQQIVDAIATTAAVNLGESPAVAMGMLFQVEAQAFGIGMQNAVAAQNGMRQITEAMTATACARILAMSPDKATAP